MAGDWSDLPELDTVLNAAEAKDLRNNKDTQKAFLGFCVAIALAKAGMQSNHPNYPRLRTSFVEWATRNNMIPSLLKGDSRSRWTGQKHLKKLCGPCANANLTCPGRYHHLPAEILISGLLVYKTLPFTRVSEGQLNEWIEYQAAFLTMAIFSWDPVTKPALYACSKQYSDVPDDEVRPSSSADAQAAAEAICQSAEVHFSVNPNHKHESAEHKFVHTGAFEADHVYGALRAALGDDGAVFDPQDVERP